MAFRIERTAKAEEQLREIILYRRELTHSTESALKLLDRLEKGFSILAEYPENGPAPRYAALRARGFRVLIVDKYLAFYRIDQAGKTVAIYAVVDGRRDYMNLI